MSDLIVSTLQPGTAAGKVATTIDDPDYPGEFVASWEDPATPTAGDVGAIPAGDVTLIDVVTQAAYDALTPPVSTTLYVIVG